MTKAIAQNNNFSAKLFLEQCAARVSPRIRESVRMHSDIPLANAICYASLNGGKQVRPGLVYATALALELEFELVDAIACAVELIHCYSLTHDDLPAMDNDDMRRGMPACHKAFGEAEAILAGNAMQALAFEHLVTTSRLSDSHKIAAIRMLASAAGLNGMASGQAMDIRGFNGEVDLAYLEKVHRLKTGSLMATCITVPLVCKEHCPDFVTRALNKFAADIGLCFQIQDDILDASNPTHCPACPDDGLNYPSAIGIAKSRELLERLSKRCLSYLDCLDEKAAMLRAIARYITTLDR